jgi:hypothetical protein
VCAIAAAHGKLDFYRLHDPAGAMDDAARAMQERVRFVGRDDWTDMEAGRRAIVTITTRAGARHTEEVQHRPVDAAELDSKFFELVIPRLGRDKASRVAASLKALESAPRIGALMKELAAG